MELEWTEKSREQLRKEVEDFKKKHERYGHVPHPTEFKVRVQQQSKEHKFWAWILKHSVVEFKIPLLPRFIRSKISKKVSDTSQY
jgi:hypothetical protein